MTHRPHLRALAAGALALAAFATTGCMTKTVRTPVFESNLIEVYLRGDERMGRPVELGYDQPATIAPVRITNMLARIEVRKEGSKERQPAIPTDLLYPVGEGISRALAKADPNQVVVVMAKQRKRSMGVFTQDYLTSALAWVEGDKIYFKLAQLDSPLSKNPHDKVPEPKMDDVIGKNRVVPSEGIGVEGPQLASANWRDPIFKDSGVISIRAGGQVVRRTVLLDSGEETTTPAEPTQGAPVPPQGLSPEALRALADLEEERRRGQVTEVDYQAKRREILGTTEPAAP